MDIQDFDYLGKHIVTQPPQDQKTTPLTFLSLSRTVRDCVYDYYFTHSFHHSPTTAKKDRIITCPSDYNPHIQLLFTTRQIYSEAHPIFYTAHFPHLFFAPDSPRAAYALITGLAHYHAESCRGQIRIYPNMHDDAGLRVVSGYRYIDDADINNNNSLWAGVGGYFVSVESLELGLGDCEGQIRHVLLAAQQSDNKGGGEGGFAAMMNVERYLCGLDWHLRITTPSSSSSSSFQKEEGEFEEEDEKVGGLVLTGFIGVLNCLCRSNQEKEAKSLPRLKIQVTRKVVKNIGSRFREIS